MGESEIKGQFLRVYVDFNYRETENDVIVIPGAIRNEAITEADLSTGLRIVVYDETMECQAVVRQGTYASRWVADLVSDTIEDHPFEP